MNPREHCYGINSGINSGINGINGINRDDAGRY
jgi:hypothetical protein